jgi:hypothetical protein
MAQGKSFQIEREKSTRALRHLFGPVVLVAALILLFILAVGFFWGKPAHPTDRVKANQVTSGLQVASGLQSKHDLTTLLDYQYKDYKANLAKLDANISLQALLIAITVLLIVRRSDSLTLFGNSVPLSWLHFFVPVLLIYLWLSFGFILHELIWGRIRGIELIKALNNIPLVEYQKGIFHDAGFIDGWFLKFVDTSSSNYSGINKIFSPVTGVFLLFVLGTFISTAHASTLAIVSFGCRRYLHTRSHRWLYWYYLLPLVPLFFLLSSHVLFAYGGDNRNWIHLYVAVVTIPLLLLLRWLAAVVDKTVYPDSVHCLRRHHLLTYFPSIERPTSWRGPEPKGEVVGRTISLIGDSLSTAFHISSPPTMLVRMWGEWKRNWFLNLPREQKVHLSVVERLSSFGTITGVHHASSSAMVDNGHRRSILDLITDTWHFSHQVDEVLVGRFPDLLLIWIGHNNLDWKSKANSRTHESFLALSDNFIHSYEKQLLRLLNSALASNQRVSLVVFGLINFEAFFQAREEAESMRRVDGSLYPHLESGYRHFVSMKPEYRDGIKELASLCNQKLNVLCQRLGEQLSGTNVRLVYSDAMAVAKVDSADSLCAVDAWHPSSYGHSVIADSAYPIVHDQAIFLDWTSPTPAA